MNKGGYRGGSAIIGPRSGWFSSSAPKKRPLSKAAAVGNAVTAARAEARAAWTAEDNPSILVSAEELSSIVGPAKKQPASVREPSSDVKGTPSKREHARTRQEAKRRRLGLDG